MLTYRGTAMPAAALAFFNPGTKYRTNMYLATSFRSVVAKNFMRRRSCSPAPFADQDLVSSDIPSGIPFDPVGRLIPSYPISSQPT